ncbi:glucose 1-dehydrogenase [Sinomonas albida]|uniref:glucose 1-dehydrogenase n=1 Tax=Sinomonas albida TaxID=369942 RepID=UPI003016496E
MGWFDGKAGLVTGAAGGIGRASAVAYAAEGGSVIVADLESSRAKGEETVAMIHAAGGNAAFIPVDVSDDAQVEALVDATVREFGRLDFALNNAGIVEMGFTADISEQAWDRLFEVNIKGVWLCLKHELRYMRAHGGGSIVNTASESGLVGTPLASPYVSAKHAVVGLTKTAAGEYANMGIRINAIAPGSVWTPLMASAPAEAQEMLMAPQPMHRFGTPEEIANAVIWLSSHKASFITGITLPIDGGATASAQSFDPNLSPTA